MRAAILVLLVIACGSSSAVAGGRVVRTRFHSDALGVDKSVVIYLPAGYDAAPARHWPVFYYLHGLGGDQDDWVDGNHLDVAADRMALGAILVMPDGDAGFYSNSLAPIDYDACMAAGTGLFTPDAPRAQDCVRHRNYEDYIVKDLIHYVDTTYRTITTRDGRAIAGLSMGGFGAWMLAFRHPELFAATASHSGVVALLYGGPDPYVPGKVRQLADPGAHFGDAFPPIGAWVRTLFGTDLANWQAHDPASLLAKLKPGQLALYLDCGTEDGYKLNDEAAWVHDLLTARKIEHTYFEGPGGHDPRFWTAREPFSLAFLRDHTTAAR